MIGITLFISISPFPFSAPIHNILHFEVIKVKAEKSPDLVQKHSLMCKLLALKADDTDIRREELVCEIYKSAARMNLGCPKLQK